MIDTAGDVGEDSGPTREVWREGFTMALYISLSLIAVMAALPAPHEQSRLALSLTLLLASVGLVLAHQIAFRLSSRLVQPGSTIEAAGMRLLTAQIIGGAAVTAIAVLPVLVFGSAAYWVSGLLLLLFVLGVGYLVARTKPVSRLRALLYVGFIAVLVIGVLVVKTLSAH